MSLTTDVSPRDAADKNSWVRRSSARASADAASARTRIASARARSWAADSPPPRPRALTPTDPSAAARMWAAPGGAAAPRDPNSASTTDCARDRRFSRTARVPSGKSAAIASYRALGMHSSRATVSVRTAPACGTSVKKATSATASPSPSSRPPCTVPSSSGISSWDAPEEGAVRARAPETQMRSSATWSPSDTTSEPGMSSSTWDAANIASTKRMRAAAPAPEKR